MVYGRYNYSFHGVYKPTNITGGHHPVGLGADAIVQKIMSLPFQKAGYCRVPSVASAGEANPRGNSVDQKEISAVEWRFHIFDTHTHDININVDIIS